MARSVPPSWKSRTLHTSTRGPFVLLVNSRLIPRLSFDSGKEKHCAGHRHGSASQLREVDQPSGAEYLDFACCYAGLLGVFRRYNGSRAWLAAALSWCIDHDRVTREATSYTRAACMIQIDPWRSWPADIMDIDGQSSPELEVSTRDPVRSWGCPVPQTTVVHTLR